MAGRDYICGFVRKFPDGGGGGGGKKGNSFKIVTLRLLDERRRFRVTQPNDFFRPEKRNGFFGVRDKKKSKKKTRITIDRTGKVTGSSRGTVVIDTFANLT